jgi:hypothetical protein
LLTAIHVAEEVCFPVAHRQVVLTIPKRLRLHTRFDRKLLGELSSCAWTCLKAEAQRLLNRDDIVPGMIAAIQTHGELLHWHPHIHVLITCGAYTPEGDFLELPQFDMDRLLVAWQSDVPNRIAVSLNSMGRLKRNWLPVVVVLHQKVEASGRSGCWPIEQSNWNWSIQSATKPYGRR